ncbi:hypothetical protein [Paenibacillus humicus]|uniref:hypothetical protein n=1 Tax=Paenibacillus humicus TaxID=412861 RepID=UPI0013E3EDEF
MNFVVIGEAMPVKMTISICKRLNRISPLSVAGGKGSQRYRKSRASKYRPIIHQPSEQEAIINA